MHNYKSLAIQMASSVHQADILNAEFNDLVLSGMDAINCWNRLQEVNKTIISTKNQIFSLTAKEVNHGN